MARVLAMPHVMSAGLLILWGRQLASKVLGQGWCGVYS